MLDVRNEFIMAPLKLGYTEITGQVNERHILFYTRRSEHIGAVTLEPLYFDKGLRELPTQLGIDDDSKIPGLKILVDKIHSKGAKVIAHLNHPGRMANPNIPGNYYLSSTDKACENGGVVPKRMARKDMNDVINLWVNGAKRAETAGFDFIELQMGHGYLLAQFISPVVNDRRDEYGGTFEKRIRFPLEVLRNLMESVSIPVIVRISGEEMIPGGINPEEMIELSKILQKEGAAAIHVSVGSICSSPPWFFQHMFIKKGKSWELARKIKSEIEIPVIFVGRINSYEDIERLKSEYGAEYFAVGRAMVADPDFVGKYLGKVEGNMRPCMACSEGCLGGVKSGRGLQCVVNPLAGREEIVPEIAKDKKRIAVVGGGLAGMEAALVLWKRGHAVDLYEKNEPGGQFNLAWLPPKKEPLRKILIYYLQEIESSGVNLIKEEVDEARLLSGNYDEVVLATGAVPVIPPIKGLTRYFWTEFLRDENLPENNRIVIIGGGLIGVEVASKLVEKGNHVVIIEMLEEIARGMEMIEKKLTLKKLKESGVEIYTKSTVTEISGGTVKVTAEKDFVVEDVDHIVVTTGMKSYNPLGEKLEGKIKFHLVGDAKKVGKAQDAISDGFFTAISI